MTKAELPERIETERLLYEFEQLRMQKLSMLMLVFQKFLTQQAFRPSRPWKMKSII